MPITDKDPGGADVVVVGAGPVGLLLASELALGGARPLVLEQLTEPSATIKAGSINLASAELLSRRGLVDDLRRAQARAVVELADSVGGAVGAEIASRAGRGIRAAHFAGIPLDTDLADDDDPRLAGHLDCLDGTFVAQRDVESLLGAHAERLEVDVRRGVTFRGWTQDKDGVTVRTDDGELRAGWLVGCDGGRSAVRHLTGVEFPGTEPEITGRQGVLDIRDDAGLCRGWNWSPNGVYCYGPGAGRVLTVEFDGPPADRTSPVTADELQRSLANVSGVDVVVDGLIGAATRWTDNARQADSYRHGRVLLAGDAAHVHSPFSGQGLNLGLGDAMNLGWKLAAVITGRSTADLLDTYTAERHPVGSWVLEWTRAQVALMRPDVKVGAARRVVTDLVAGRDGMTHMVAEISGVARRAFVDDTDCELGRTITDLVLDDGRPARDAFATGRFVLVNGDGLTDVTASWQDRIEPVHIAGARPSLVRPDGVIAWIGRGEPDRVALTAALQRWAGQPTDRLPPAGSGAA